jgi:molybdate transport system substrate-binding protein
MTMSRRIWLGQVVGLTAAILVVWGPAKRPAVAQGGDVLVFAAASLKNALDAINAQWQRDTGKKATISYAASSALAKQIEQGAPAQLFISADLDWMGYLAGKNLIKPETRSNLLGNRIVLIAQKDKARPVEIKTAFDLAKILGDGRLSVANVDSVPAGKYGKAALEKLGVWESVSGKIAQAENVRAALLLVSRGEAPVGIVYQTDAAADPNVAIIGTFPADTHPPTPPTAMRRHFWST